MLRQIVRAQRSRRADHVAAEPDRRRLFEREQMGGDDVLEVDSAVEQLVDLDVEVVVGFADLVAVVGLGKEPGGAQDQTRQPVVLPDQLTQILGGGLGRAVDVPRNRDDVLGDPGGRLSRGGGESPPERARRAREDEPADVRPRRLPRAGSACRRCSSRRSPRGRATHVGLVERRAVRRPRRHLPCIAARIWRSAIDPTTVVAGDASTSSPTTSCPSSRRTRTSASPR